MLRPILVKLALSHWGVLFGFDGSEDYLAAMPELCADMLVAKMTKDKARKPMDEECVLHGHKLRDPAAMVNYNLRAASKASLKRKSAKDVDTIVVKK